jgi:hypothetical protein
MRLVENEEWVEQQFEGCDLNNSMRTRRLKKAARNMLGDPNGSLPKQNCNWSDVKAVYRLLDREEVTFGAVAECHWRQTRSTIGKGRYLLISDTTDFKKLYSSPIKELTHLGPGIDNGMQLHSCLAIDSSNGLVQGMAGALLHYRKRVPKSETTMQRLGRTRESQVWGNLVQQIGPPTNDSQWIHVFDRGGDNFESLCNIVLNECDWVIRVGKTHRLVKNAAGELVKLSEALKDAVELGSYEIDLRSRPGQPARTAKIIVSSTSTTIQRPKCCSPFTKKCGIHAIETNVVIVEEVNAPKDMKPIRWVLMTSLPAKTFEQACQVIEDYEYRWHIEEYHKVIKSGCKIEGHSLRTLDRLEALIGLVSVIGARLLQLKTIGKADKAAVAYNRVPQTWLKAMKHLKPRIQMTKITVYEFFREIAKLGGFLARKSDGEPGWQTTWHGYHKLQLIVRGIEIGMEFRHQKHG